MVYSREGKEREGERIKYFEGKKSQMGSRTKEKHKKMRKGGR